MLSLSKVTIRYTALYLPCSIEYKLKLTSQKNQDSILFERKTIRIVTLMPASPGFEAK
jgi:hypothetical protein